MRKFIAMALIALLGVGLLSACGAESNPDPTESTSGIEETQDIATTLDEIIPEPESTEEETSLEEGSTEEETSTEDAAAVNADGETTTTQPGDTTKQTETTVTTSTTKTTTVSGKAGVLQAYKTAVDKTLAANPKTKKSWNTTIKKPLNADDGLTKLLGISIAGFNVQNVVCNLLGEGSGSEEKNAKEVMQKCTLTVDDITSASSSTDKNGNLVLDLGVKGGKNPYRNKSPLGRFTSDFTDLDRVAEGIKDAEGTVPGLKINIAKKEFNYSDIKIHAVIGSNGRLVSMTHSYKYTAKVEGVEVKLMVTVGKGEWASGSATGKQEYSFH